jgi:autoinducer 2-degrading protein
VRLVSAGHEDMYAVLNIIKVRQEHLKEFIENVRNHAKSSVREPGCLRFDVLQDIEDPQTICLYEVFRTESDLETHRRQDYYNHWMTMSHDWREISSSSRRILDHIYPPDDDWTPQRT